MQTYCSETSTQKSVFQQVLWVILLPVQVQKPLVLRQGTGLGAGKLGLSIFPSVERRVGLDQGMLVAGARQVTQSEVGQLGNVTPERACALSQLLLPGLMEGPVLP